MGWDDSDDEFDIDAALNKHQEKKEKGSEEESSEEEAPAPPPKAKAPAKKAAAKKKEEGYVPLDDPVAEKIRKQKLIEESDAALASDLFADMDKPKPKKEEAKPKDSKVAEASSQKVEVKTIYKDSLEDLQVKMHSHVEGMTKMVVPKLKEATAKNAKVKFIEDTFKAISSKLELTEMEKVQKAIKDALAVRKKKEAEDKKKAALQEIEDKKKKEEELAQEAKAKGEVRVSDEDFFAQFM